jgi:hypothetical protein
VFNEIKQALPLLLLTMIKPVIFVLFLDDFKESNGVKFIYSFILVE